MNTKPPEIIYLQWIPYPSIVDEITWCVDAIHEEDTEYIRADKVEQLRKALEDWHNMFEWGDFIIDFSNDNVHNGIDEGEVTGQSMLKDMIKATKQALAANKDND